MLIIDQKLYCPNCGEELPSGDYTAFLDDKLYYECGFCGSEVTVEMDKDEYKIIVNKGW